MRGFFQNVNVYEYQQEGDTNPTANGDIAVRFKLVNGLDSLDFGASFDGYDDSFNIIKIEQISEVGLSMIYKTKPRIRIDPGFADEPPKLYLYSTLSDPTIMSTRRTFKSSDLSFVPMQAQIAAITTAEWVEGQVNAGALKKTEAKPMKSEPRVKIKNDISDDDKALEQRLKKLKKLLDTGLISKDEAAKKRKEILEGL